MTRQDYVRLAEIAGRTLAAAYEQGGEAARTAIYDEVYVGISTLCGDDNDRFDRARFSFAVAEVELSYANDRAESRAGTQ